MVKIKRNNSYKSVREKLRLTQTEFAFILELDRSTWAKIETNARGIPAVAGDKYGQIFHLVMSNQQYDTGARPSESKRWKSTKDAIKQYIGNTTLKIHNDSQKLKVLQEQRIEAISVLEKMGTPDLNLLDQIRPEGISQLSSGIHRLQSEAEGKDYLNILKLQMKIAGMKASLAEAIKINEEFA